MLGVPLDVKIVYVYVTTVQLLNWGHSIVGKHVVNYGKGPGHGYKMTPGSYPFLNTRP